MLRLTKAVQTYFKNLRHIRAFGTPSRFPTLANLLIAVGGMLRLIQVNRGRLTLFVILVIAAAVGIWSLVHFWDWLQIGEAGKESGSTTVRNISFVTAGVVALPFAFWRSWVAHRQADTADQNLLNERYQQGAEMLGSDVLTVRLGGIYALQRLAEEHPEQYQIQIMQMFCAFVRHPTQRDGTEAQQKNFENERDAGEEQTGQEIPGVARGREGRHERRLFPQ